MYKPKKIALYFIFLFLLGICGVFLYFYLSADKSPENFIEVVE